MGIKISGSTVANIMHRHGFNPPGERMNGGMTLAEFIRIHKELDLGYRLFHCRSLDAAGTGNLLCVVFHSDQTGQAAGEVFQFECLRGTMGKIGEK